MTNENELNKVLKPVICGFWPDQEMPDEAQTQSILNIGIRNIYLYMQDLDISIVRFRNLDPQ